MKNTSLEMLLEFVLKEISVARRDREFVFGTVSPDKLDELIQQFDGVRNVVDFSYVHIEKLFSTAYMMHNLYVMPDRNKFRSERGKKVVKILNTIIYDALYMSYFDKTSS